ncbi:MAG: hypothetical protein ACJASQ_003937 [Crocinitomicaceae bacterium]
MDKIISTIIQFIVDLSLYCIQQQSYKNLSINIKPTDMKRVLAFAFLGLILTAVVASCGSSKGGHCDAYGNKSGSVENVDDSQLPS